MERKTDCRSKIERILKLNYINTLESFISG